MAPLDVCPTEDALQAFLEHLVDPSLPAKSSLRDNPTPSRQLLVAKQVRSVVLLYNYYHRKQHPELEYLPFNEFCKLAVVLRPGLLAYTSFMQKLSETDLVDMEKQLSLTEKMIIDGCDVSKCLDASKNVPNIEGWPISKVAVFLINSTKECCLLQFGSITNGVWSVVEKDLDVSSRSSEVTPGTKNTYIKKRVIRKPTKDELIADESGFLQVGYSAVKEAAGINNSDITLLGSYTVYSQSKEKAASRFYIMQCSQLICQDAIQVPIKDLIQSMRGPLVNKSCGSWAITPVVDYFHVLPYSEIISDWISSQAFSNSMQVSRVTQKYIIDNPKVTESYASEDAFIGLNGKPSSYNIELLKQKENNGRFTLEQSDLTADHRDMDLDKSSISKSPKKEKCQYIANADQVGEDHVVKNTPFMQYYSNGSTSAAKHHSTSLAHSAKDTHAARNEAHHTHQPPSSRPLSVNFHQHQSTSIDLSAKDACAGRNEAHHSHQPPSSRPLSVNFHQHQNTSLALVAKDVCAGQNEAHHSYQPPLPRSLSVDFHQAEKVDTSRMLIPVGGMNNLAPCNRNCTKRSNTSIDLEKLQALLDSKGKLLSEAALSSLIRKRNELTLQQREIEDEIAMCDKKIQRMLTDGEDDFELKIESIIQGCNDIWAKNQERMFGHQSLSPCTKRKKMSEAGFIMRSSCQELDGVCHDNNWVIPTYRLSQKDGGIHADVTVKGLEFESSCRGNVCSGAQEARESAAAQMLANLRSMAKSAH